MLTELHIGCWSSEGAELHTGIWDHLRPGSISLWEWLGSGRGGLVPGAEEPHYLEVSTGGGACKETE